jgi:hypothetical protein
MVHLHSSLLFVPDVSFNTFSSFRSTPNNYLFSTERWFTASACSATVIDLLSSFIQHSLLLQISNDSRHTLPLCKRLQRQPDGACCFAPARPNSNHSLTGLLVELIIQIPAIITITANT